MRKLLLILAASFWAIVVPTAIIWTHNVFVTGLNPFLGTIFLLLLATIALVFAIRAIPRLSKRYAENRAFTPAMLFAVAGVSWTVSGIWKEVLARNSAMHMKMSDTYDIMLHDTYYVIAAPHMTFALALIFGIFCALYYTYPRLFRRPLNPLLSYIHFWVTFVGTFFILWPRAFTEYHPMAGMPRRYLDYSNWTSPIAPQYFGWGPYVELIMPCLFIAQLLFVFNFFFSLRKGRKVEIGG